MHPGICPPPLGCHILILMACPQVYPLLSPKCPNCWTCVLYGHMENPNAVPTLQASSMMETLK